MKCVEKTDEGVSSAPAFYAPELILVNILGGLFSPLDWEVFQTLGYHWGK